MKMKKIVAAVLATAMTAMSIPSVTAEEYLSVIDVMKASGATVEVKAGAESPAEDFEYRINEDGESVTVTEYKGNGGDVVIPGEIDGKKVTEIGSYAFSFCISLTSVEIPDGVTGIEVAAFYHCPSLISVVIPDSVIKIKGGSFLGCISLASVKIPNGVTSIGSSAFEGCTSLASVEIPNSVIEIGDRAFGGCTSLMSVEIPNSVTKMGDMTFDYCISLKSVKISNSVTEIGYMAFHSCTSLTSIEIPNSVTVIEDYAFEDCTSFTSIEIPDSVTSIKSGAFCRCTSLASVEIPIGLTEIANQAFSDCSSLKSIVVDEKNSNFSSANGILFNKNKTALIQYPAGKEEESYSIPNSVTDIGNFAFSGCIFLTSVEIPNSVAKIGSNAFSRCSSFTSVRIPSSVTELGSSIFRGCTSLTSVEIPDSVTEIGYETFKGCTSLISVEIPESVTEIGWNAFEGCASLISINIPSRVTEIKKEAFSDCTSLKSINVDEKNANYSSLDGVLFNKDKTTLIQYPAGKTDKSYLIPNSVARIEIHVFDGCTFLTSVEIPNSVIEIGEWAFNSCISLTSVKIPNGVKTIEYKAFEDCSSITSVEIPNSVTYIGTHAFYGCTSLKSINVDEENANYSSLDGVFFNKEKTTLIQYPAAKTDNNYSIPNSVKKIGDYAFSNCTSLTSVEVLDGMVDVGDLVFEGCTSLKSISVDEKNAEYSSIDGVLYDKSKTSLIQYPVGKTDKNYLVFDSVRNIESHAFHGCSFLTSVEIPGSVMWIGLGAFKDCPFLTIYGYENSYAKAYAKYDVIPFKIIGKEAAIDHENNIIIENSNLENKTLEVEKSADSTNEKIIFNITLKDEDGNEIQPEGDVTVKIPLPEGWNAKKTTISRREKDGTLTDMKATCENGYMVFVTDHFSEYILSVKPDVKIADLNNDGKITTVDAKWVLQAVSGSRTLTPEQEAASDVNGDGKITTVDAKWILQIVSGSRMPA